MRHNAGTCSNVKCVLIAGHEGQCEYLPNPRISFCKRHTERVIYDGTENHPTACRWCARCGAIFHPIRIKGGGWSKRLYWQLPHAISQEPNVLNYKPPPSMIDDD